MNEQGLHIYRAVLGCPGGVRARGTGSRGGGSLMALGGKKKAGPGSIQDAHWASYT